MLEHPNHRGIQNWIRDLNAAYRREESLHRSDFDAEGFQWVDCENRGQSVLSHLRRSGTRARPVLLVYNFSAELHRDYRVGVPTAGRWEEILNSDSEHYAGSGEGNLGAVVSEPIAANGHDQSILLTLPALSALFLAPSPPPPKRPPARSRK